MKKQNKSKNTAATENKDTQLSNEPFDLEKTYNILNTGKNEDGTPIPLVDTILLYRRAIVYLLGLEVQKTKTMKEIWYSDALAMEEMARQAKELSETTTKQINDKSV